MALLPDVKYDRHLRAASRLDIQVFKAPMLSSPRSSKSCSMSEHL